MKESQIQTLFKQHLENSPPISTCVYELKLEKTKRLAFSKIKQHQLDGLYKAKHSVLFHKLTDMPHMFGAKTRFDMKKPFDCFTIYKAEAYLGVCFYQPRKPKELILIDIDNLLQHMSTTKMKSIDEKTARFMAEDIIVLKNNYGSKKDS